jgi:enoyl-CoA hydratase
MPGEIGTFCALTGERLKVGDGVASGLATHAVAAGRFAELTDALCTSVSVDAVLAAFAEPAGEAPVASRRATIDRLFAADRVEDILSMLDAEAASARADAAWAHATAATIREKSPLSLKIALAQVRRGRNWSFEECMQAEFRIVSRIVYGWDFYEGIRAVIIDKDNAPVWRPRRLADVTDDDVEAYFAPLADELDLT